MGDNRHAKIGTLESRVSVRAIGDAHEQSTKRCAWAMRTDQRIRRLTTRFWCS
jgi:hypothetical protein